MSNFGEIFEEMFFLKRIYIYNLYETCKAIISRHISFIGSYSCVGRSKKQYKEGWDTYQIIYQTSIIRQRIEGEMNLKYVGFLAGFLEIFGLKHMS